MPTVSAAAKKRAWQRAKADADAVEAAALGSANARGEHSRREGLLLDRLRSQKYADQVGEAWLGIEQYQKTTGNGQRVIRGLLDALTLSANAALMWDDYQRDVRRLGELKSFADQLQAYFSGKNRRDPMWKIVAHAPSIEPLDFGNVRATLRRISTFLDNRIDDSRTAFTEIGLTRERGAEHARRVVFTAALSSSMRNIFGRPLDGIVKTLTDVALDTETTLDQVKHARVNAARRKRRTDPLKI
jgi:hypothetical protein